MNVKLWIAMCADYGETCDRKPRLLDVCKSRDEALAVVRADIEKWADDRAGMPIVVDFDKMSAKYDWKTLDGADGCEWRIEERTCSFNDEDELVVTADDNQLEFDFV